MSRRMNIGIQLFPGSPRQVLEEARRCEELGFDSVWVADHFHGAGRDVSWVVPELFTLLGAMAVSTSRAGIGSCVVSLAKRSPAIVAQGALTLAALSGGRFRLGIGTGFGPDLRAFGIDTSASASRFEEAVRVIRGLFAASESHPFSFDGRWSRLDGAFLNVPVDTRPPLFVAAQAPRMLAITSEHADGWIPFALPPDLYREILTKLEPRALSFTPSLWIPTFVERSGEDRTAEAEATGRLYLSMAPAVLRVILGDDRAATPTNWTAAHGSALADAIPRELALAVTLHGSPSACAEQLAAFADAGCRAVVLRITDARRRQEDAETFARAVFPRLDGREVVGVR
jgi:phthiodiolone/phenolphthiodiolone dimycocerosates ketoreductase